MDANSFFIERVNHFEEERKLIAKYKALITPSKGEIHHLSWETSAQQENVEAAGQEVKNIIDDIELAQKELTLKREELEELKEAQESRKAQLSRLSQLAQPIETDVTYLFNEKPLKNNGKGLVESVPLRHQAPPNAYKKQVKTGELLQLESKLHDVTRMAYGRFSEFDTTFVNANILSRQCEDTVVDKVQSSIDRAASLIAEMDHLDQQSFFSVSELLRLRLNIMVAQRLEVEELENLTKEREYFEKKERELHEQLLTEVKQMKIRLKHELATCTRDLQRQLNNIKSKRDRLNMQIRNEELCAEAMKRPGTINILKDRKKEIVKLENKKNEKIRLEKHLAFVKNRFLRLQEHYRLEMEGYQTEMKMMKNELNKIVQNIK